MRKVILYGAGQCGKEALAWFGDDSVVCFIDNNIEVQKKVYVVSVQYHLPILWRSMELMANGRVNATLILQLSNAG